MATTLDGHEMIPVMPDFSATSSPFSSAGDFNFHLQNLLETKKEQLNQAALFGQQILDQQKELQERVRQLQEIEGDKDEDDEIEHDSRERYRELAETISAWESRNAQSLSSAFASNPFLNGKEPPPSMPYVDLPREEHERPKAGSSAAQSRRAKNAAHRADNVEFALEIGSGLLTEVRRLQSLLGERDKAIQDMKEEKDDLEKTLESFRTALRQQEQSADKFKEENWNLEVTLQDLRSQLSDSQAGAQRLETEQKHLTKLLAAARDAGDQHKNEAERLTNVVEEMKAKHQTDIAHHRKHAAGLTRDKSDLQQTVDTLKAEIARTGRRLPRFGSPLTPNGRESTDFLTPGDRNEEDVFLSTGGASTNRRKHDTSGVFPAEGFGSESLDSLEPSPIHSSLLRSQPNSDFEKLREDFAHAQRQIVKLRSSLQKEKEMKMDLRRQLMEQSPGGFSPMNAEEEEDEADYEDEDTVETKPSVSTRKVTPYRRGVGLRGRGRGRPGLTLAERLNLAANSPSPSEYNDDVVSSSPPPPVPSIPIRFQHAEDDPFAQDNDEIIDEEAVEDVHNDTQVPGSPSPFDVASHRTSVDGMDPAFANVLKRTPSTSSIPHTGSPLRHSSLSRSGRGRGGTVGRRPRGGAAYQAVRPPSIVGQPEVLAAELNIGGSPMKDNSISEERLAEFVDETEGHTEMAEIGCQTEAYEEEVKPMLSEIAIQVEPEPEPVPEPKVLADGSVQTEPVIVERTEIGVQHEVEPSPVLMSTGMNTEPEEGSIQAQTQATSMSTAEADTQTTISFTEIPSPKSLVGYDPNRRTTITQYDVSTASGDSTITRPITRSFLSQQGQLEDEEMDEGEETETGAETETETDAETETETETDPDDYHDASQSVILSAASASQDDFHSMMTMTDNDFSESEDDGESIKVSRLPSRAGTSVASSVAASGRPSSFYADVPPPAPPVTYEEKGVSAEIVELEPEKAPEPEPEPELEVEATEPPKPEPKPEMKEMSIQTDEWMPPPPPSATPVPLPAPASPSFSRIGSTSHQFQFIPPPPTSPPSSVPLHTTPVTVPIPVSTQSSPNVTVGHMPDSTADKRQSIESAMSSVDKDDTPRSRVPSGGTMLTVVDKTKPPMMALPPPPRQPPPPNAMPPPNFIPERRMPTTSTGSHDLPPPRPSSPPPPELIQRATTPTFGSALSVPGKANYILRQHGSMPPSQSGLRQPPSTSSFRSAANAANYAQNQTLAAAFNSKERREFSSTSLMSERSMASPRSSISSDHQLFANHSQGPSAPVTPNKTADLSTRMTPGGRGSTDPTVIHAITQTMIGEFLYKYTRRAIGKGYGQTRHKRFFWVHPYTKTLYWSSADPGSWNVSESSAKSAYIEGVRSVLDPNPMPPGLYQYSVVVSTPQREMKLTAPTKERHDIWLNALKYLLSRPSEMNIASPANNNTVPQSPISSDFAEEDRGRRPPLTSSPQSQRSGRSVRKENTWNTTPRGKRSRSQLSVGGSVGKRSGTPAAEYLRWNGPESPYSPSKSFEHVAAQDDDDLDFELHVDSRSEDGFEGLENVRACCDGRHTVGRHAGRHRHHHIHEPQNGDHHLDVNPQERPASPAWSLRSRTGSAHSHDGGTGIFSWGRGEDGKLRFGSRRSAKTVISQDR